MRKVQRKHEIFIGNYKMKSYEEMKQWKSIIRHEKLKHSQWDQVT